MEFSFKLNDKIYNGFYTIPEDKKSILVSFSEEDIKNIIGSEIVFTFNEETQKYHFGINNNVLENYIEIYGTILYSILELEK